MSLLLEFLKHGFDPWVLPQRLYECADRVERRQIHLLLQLLETPRRESLPDPILVIGKAELRNTNQEVVWAETIEGGQPTFGALKVLPESVDIRRSRRDNTPPEYSNPHRQVDPPGK